MVNSSWFKETHGFSKERLYNRWYNAKASAKKRGISWELGEYVEFRDKYLDGFYDGAMLSRTDRTLGFTHDNTRWVGKPKKKHKPTRVIVKRPKKHIADPDTSPDWFGF